MDLFEYGPKQKPKETPRSIRLSETMAVWLCGATPEGSRSNPAAAKAEHLALKEEYAPRSFSHVPCLLFEE